MMHLPELTIYISHTCDLACDDCFTYNNLNWKKHFDVNKEPEILKGLVTFDEIFILGGEPLMNPYLPQWMDWVDFMWPESKKWIVTNGRHMDKVNWSSGWNIEISAHSPLDLLSIKEWLDKNGIHYEKFYNNKHTDAEWHYVLSKDGKEIGELSEAWVFYKSNVDFNSGEKITWKMAGDKNEQHLLCPAKECMHLLDGRFYRCPQQALVPQLANTFVVEGDTRDLGCNSKEFLEWAKTRLDPQDLCKFCTWNEKFQLPEKSKIKKIKVSKI